jgi:hypothetical protein
VLGIINSVLDNTTSVLDIITWSSINNSFNSHSFFASEIPFMSSFFLLIIYFIILSIMFVFLAVYLTFFCEFYPVVVYRVKYWYASINAICEISQIPNRHFLFILGDLKSRIFKCLRKVCLTETFSIYWRY